MIFLACDGWEVDILPHLGGALGGLRHDGIAVLRPTPRDTIDILQTANFALLPYANRLAAGRFLFDGKTYDLPRNFGDHPHTLHGTGWQSDWDVAIARDDAALLVLERPASPAWPWAYRAEQRLTLGSDGLCMALTLTNRDSRAMPAGLGFHPYFPRDTTSRLALRAERVWLSDEQQIPTISADARLFGDWGGGAPARHDELIDNAYEGWDGRVVLSDARGTTLIEASGARGVHLYLPPGSDFLCVEPVSHLPDAFNRNDMPFDVVTPGATLELSMRIRHGH